MTEQEFRTHERVTVVAEFEVNGQKFVLYTYHAYSDTFVSGERFSWSLGIRWDRDIKALVRDVLVEDEIKRKIESLC